MSAFNKKPDQTVFIAHRGYSHKYPENSLLAMRRAFECGACFVECDVQLTKDKVPVLMHDADLLRASGIDLKLRDLTYSELKKISIGYAEKFGERYQEERLPSLEEFVALLKQWPDRGAFVEIKRSSIRQFGIEPVLQVILPVLSAIQQQLVIISFDDELISRLNLNKDIKTGWVIDQWTEENLQRVAELSPDYFFVDHECLPPGFDWIQQSNGSWVLYEVDDPDLAYQFAQNGVRFIETNDIESMLKSEKFPESGCP